jgi:hypothetical protein
MCIALLQAVRCISATVWEKVENSLSGIRTFLGLPKMPAARGSQNKVEFGTLLEDHVHIAPYPVETR